MHARNKLLLCGLIAILVIIMMPLAASASAGDWQPVGSAEFSAGEAKYISLFVDGGTPYVAYSDGANSHKATVMKYDGANWVPVGSAGFSAGPAMYTSLFVDGGTPYVAYSDGDNSYKATVMYFPTYTVTYDGNGNTGGSVPTDGNTYTQGATVTVLGNTGSLVKDGCTFAGWNTAADGSGTTYQPDDTFTMGAADVTLYARWIAAPTISPGGGTFTGSLTVGIGNIAPGCAAYYTTDGTTPTVSSYVYTAPFTLTDSATVTAAVYDGSTGLWSATATANYAKYQETQEEITVTPTPVREGTTSTVNLSGLLGKAYDKDLTVDFGQVQIVFAKGSLPDSGSFTLAVKQLSSSEKSLLNGGDIVEQVFEFTAWGTFNNVTVALPLPSSYNVNKTYKVFKYMNTYWANKGGTVSGGSIQTELNSFSQYTVAESPASPAASPAAGIYYGSQSVTLSADPGCTIYYYLGNSATDWDENAKQTYSSAITLSTPTDKYLNAVAENADGFRSPLVSNRYVINTSGGDDGGGSAPQAKTTQTISAKNGGTVTAYGATIEIPASAVSADIEVKVEKVSPSGLPVPADSKLISDVFEIAKDKAGDFAKPVVITLPFDKSRVDTGKYDISIYWLDEGAKKWVELDNVKVDLASGKASGEVRHFTKFAVLATEKTEAALKDIAGHWAESYINQLVGLGAITGYPDGTFRPDNRITRAEFVTVLVKAFNLPQQGSKVFNDTAGHWARSYIAAAAASGVVKGYDESTFGPDDLITREQMALMVVKAAGLKAASGGKTFSDGDQISEWAKGAVDTASACNVIGGYPDGTFKPKDNATRAESATVIVKALKK